MTAQRPDTLCRFVITWRDIRPRTWIKLQRGETADVSGGIDYSFVDQQNGNVVPDWVNPPARAALQVLSPFRRNRLPAGGTDQDVEQVSGNHGSILYILRTETPDNARTYQRFLVRQLTFTVSASKFPQRSFSFFPNTFGSRTLVSIDEEGSG